jgi:hypothetical protein
MKKLYLKHLAFGAYCKIVVFLSVPYLMLWNIALIKKLIFDEPPFLIFRHVSYSKMELVLVSIQFSIVHILPFAIVMLVSFPFAVGVLAQTTGLQIAAVRKKYRKIGIHGDMVLMKEIYLTPIILYASPVFLFVNISGYVMLSQVGVFPLDWKAIIFIAIAPILGAFGVDAFSDWIRFFTGGIPLKGEFEVRSERRLKPKRLRNAKLPTMDDIKKDSQT